MNERDKNWVLHNLAEIKLYIKYGAQHSGTTRDEALAACNEVITLIKEI